MLTSLFFLGPRAAILVWWLIDYDRWLLAFDNFWIAFIGFLLAPWTTLMYVIVAPTGVNGFDWVWLTLAVIIDIGSYTGGAYGNRERWGYAGA
jgi:hypothetical protein